MNKKYFTKLPKEAVAKQLLPKPETLILLDQKGQNLSKSGGLQQFLKVSDLVLMFTSSLLLVLCYNFQTIKSRLWLYLPDTKIFSLISFLEILTFLSEIFIAILTIFLFFISISFNKILLKTTLVIIFFLSAVSLYILNKFGIIFDEIMIKNAFGSVGHIGEVVDSSLAIYLFFGAFLPAFFIIKSRINYQIKTKLAVFAITLIIYGVVYLTAPKQTFNKVFTIYSPINYFGSCYKYVQRFHSGLRKAKTRADLNKIYDFKYEKELENLNVVLIIGESLRADHLHINGYEKQTTPNLEKIKNLLHYQVRSSFNTTTPSVTSMLSSRTKADFVDIPPEKSIISIFKNFNFKTYWYSAQSSKEFTNGMLNIMAGETDEYFFVDKLQTSIKAGQKVYDGDLMPFFTQALNGDGNKFIILHSFGSHIRFNERSPENFKIFKPECIGLPSSCPRKLVINSYDNSVFYTDYFISSIIEKIKNTNTILFYVSDHGTFLGENDVYANGNSNQINENAHIVPMFIYMTDSVLKNRNYHKKFMLAKSKITSDNLSHDNLFDSIIDCSGVKSTILKRNLSLCQRSN